LRKHLLYNLHSKEKQYTQPTNLLNFLAQT